jgi:hypothetical protein
MSHDTTSEDRPPTDRPPVDTLSHENPYQLAEDDIHDIAVLINAVGTELTTVDKLSVDGEGSIKATKIDQQKIFNTNPIPQSRSALPPSPPPAPPEPSQPTATAPVEKVSKVTPSAEPVKQYDSMDVSEITGKLTSISSDISKCLKSLSKIDALERKVVSLEAVYDKLLTKIVKNAKRVTITVNDKN